MRMLRPLLLAATCLVVAASLWAATWTPMPVDADPLVRMPGTQPGDGVVLEGPNRCLNCHAGYAEAVEPGFNWMGSMMAQAARDPIFWACVTVAAQDAIWATNLVDPGNGRPNATDICLRCHFPAGWLGGRSDPTNASLMTGDDYDGLTCDFCHRMYDPFAPDTHSGTREGADWAGYWDEHGNTGPGSGTLSQVSADATLAEDVQRQMPTAKLFSGGDFFPGGRPKYAATYTEHGSGQYYVSAGSEKRASFADATGRHAMLYSRHHKSKYFCGVCHDVSNPVLAQVLPALPDQSGGQDLMTEQYPASRYYHVERTFSEFMVSSYGRTGAATSTEFQSHFSPPITFVTKCQDCHLRDVTGQAADMKNAVVRPSGSTEHPQSGLPLHDMTGGNLWVSYILASLDPNGPVYDATNVAILNKGPAVLTLDLAAGQTPAANGRAVKAGADRALAQLHAAASITHAVYNRGSGSLSFRIINQTGHKLISGFPEGRRMFVTVRGYLGQQPIFTVNPYDDAVGTLRGLPHSVSSPPLGPGESYEDALVYEVHPKSDLTGEEATFHFVLATGRSKDNRIPPKGFDVAASVARLCEPVWHGQSAPDYFTAAEYAGGYDDVALTVPPGADRVEITLYYQGTSREYVEFLRDEINGTATTLPPEAYIIQTDTSGFFTKLKAWGDTIWDLWRHNHGLDGQGRRVSGIVPVAMIGTEALVVEPQALGVTAGLDWDWVYQNTVKATGDRHHCVLTIGVTSDPNGNSAYGATVTVAATSTGAVAVEPTADPLVWIVRGGRVGVDPVGRVDLDIEVTGLTAGGQGAATAWLTVRRLGDVDGNGGAEPTDMSLMINRMNGKPVPYPDRAMDLDVNGGVEPTDLSMLTNLLNGVALP